MVSVLLTVYRLMDHCYQVSRVHACITIIPVKPVLSTYTESSVVITVEFSPDHPGRCYSDKLHIDINSKVPHCLTYCSK